MVIDVTDNTIVGPGAFSGETIGFDYQDGVGQTSGNMVSNFPDPPGSEQDVCHARS
jgi:hypothetical protein